MSTMAVRRDDDDEDLLEDLPDLGGLGDDEPLDDAQLGLDDEATGEREEVGLDDSTGLDDDASLYALELPPEDRVTDEEDVDAIPVEGLDGDDEYGWADTGKSEDEPFDASEVDIAELTPIGGEDRGEEGVDDAIELGGPSGDEVPHLPPMRGVPDDEDEEAEDLALGEDALIEEAVLSYDEERRQMGATLPPRLEAPACVVEHLGPHAAVHAFTLGATSLACGAGMYRVEADRAVPIDAVGIDGLDLISVAVDPRDPGRIVVGTRLAGALRSIDGRTFAPANAWAVEGREVAQSFVVRHEREGRVWGRTSGGALFRSDDFGASWTGPLILKPVVALATPEDGGVVALCAGRDAPAQIARSDDGGQRWAAVDGPSIGTSGELFLAAFRGSLAVSADEDPGGPWLSNDRGKSWTRIPGLPPTGPMALAWEPGGLTLYAAHFFDGDDRGVVVRHRPGGSESAVVLDVAREASERSIAASGDPEGDHRVYALEARREGDRTVLHVGTGAGLFRVRIDPERAA